MQLRISLFLALLAWTTSTHAALFRSPNVKHLTIRSFKKAVQGSEKLTVAAFTAPWCGYCKKLAPDFDKVADSLKGIVNVVNVDCDEEQNKPLCSEMGVQGELPLPLDLLFRILLTAKFGSTRGFPTIKVSLSALAHRANPAADTAAFTAGLPRRFRSVAKCVRFVRLSSITPIDVACICGTDYDGQRTAKDIISYATSSMPTFVKRATTADEVEALRSKARRSLSPSSLSHRPSTDLAHLHRITQAPIKPVSLLFTSAGKVTPLYKALSTDFHRSIEFYAARDTKIGEEAMRAFGVDKTPALLVLSGEGEVKRYDGTSCALFLASVQLFFSRGALNTWQYIGPLKYDKLHDFLKPFAASKGAKAKVHSEL
ncbi:SPOSA6832_01831, partial [Sporobolomyces salmonicolor]